MKVSQILLIKTHIWFVAHFRSSWRLVLFSLLFRTLLCMFRISVMTAISGFVVLTSEVLLPASIHSSCVNFEHFLWHRHIVLLSLFCLHQFSSRCCFFRRLCYLKCALLHQVCKWKQICTSFLSFDAFFYKFKNLTWRSLLLEFEKFLFPAAVIFTVHEYQCFDDPHTVEEKHQDSQQNQKLVPKWHPHSQSDDQDLQHSPQR